MIWTDIKEKCLYFEKIKSFISAKPMWNMVFCHAHWYGWVLSVVCLSHASFNFSNKYDYVYNHKLPEISFSLHSWRNRWCPAYPETDLQDYVQKNHSGEIKLCNSCCSAAVKLPVCCNPINPAPFYSLELLHWATICYNCEWEIFFCHIFTCG